MRSIESQHLRLAPDTLQEIFNAAGLGKPKTTLDTESNVGSAHGPHLRIATEGQLGKQFRCTMRSTGATTSGALPAGECQARQHPPAASRAGVAC